MAYGGQQFTLESSESQLDSKDNRDDDKVYYA